MYTYQALWTAVRHGIDAKFVVCNNRKYRLLDDNIAQYWRERDIPEHGFPGSFDLSTPRSTSPGWRGRSAPRGCGWRSRTRRSPPWPGCSTTPDRSSSTYRSDAPPRRTAPHRRHPPHSNHHGQEETACPPSG